MAKERHTTEQIIARLHHGGNPVPRWMASNVGVKLDAVGNLVPSKKEHGAHRRRDHGAGPGNYSSAPFRSQYETQWLTFVWHQAS